MERSSSLLLFEVLKQKVFNLIPALSGQPGFIAILYKHSSFYDSMNSKSHKIKMAIRGGRVLKPVPGAEHCLMRVAEAVLALSKMSG